MSTHTLDHADAPAPGLGRRDFLIRTAGGLTFGFMLQELSRLDLVEAAAAPGTVTTWLNVGSDNTVTLTIGSSEMGQGSFSGLAQILSEDLMVDYSRIRTVQGAPAMTTPAAVGTSINTVGSSVVRNNFWKMRDAAAAARELLVQAAMNQIGDQTRGSYSVVDGVISHAPSGTRLTYGQVAAAASLLPAPVGATLVPDSEFRVIGTTVPRVDIPAKVDGSAVYGLDVRVPDMVYAVIKHCPTLGGTLVATPAVPRGMLAVVPMTVVAGTSRGADATGNVNAVAVVGPNTWDVWQATKRLSVSWTIPASAAGLNDADFIAQGRALLTGGAPYAAGAANPPGTVYTVEGNAAEARSAIDGSPQVLDAVYTLPYVAHACMEVLNCTVDYVPGVKCEVWAPTQSAKALSNLVISMTGLRPDQVVVNTTYLGGGLGRKAELDFVSQAVQVARQIGRPVKLMWPREEDFTHDQYRPMAVVGVRAGLTASNAVAGFSYRNVSPSILGQRGSVLGARGDSQGIEGARDLPYNLGARSTEWVAHPSPVPVGFWRSVGASINTFAVESMIDEMAWAAGQDPYQFRRNLLTDPRWMAVLDAAANLGGWLSAPPAGRGRGIAIGTAFGSIVAQVVEISYSATSGIRVRKSSIALDCYVAVNPGQIESQLVGGMVHGMNAALYGKQSFVRGVAQAKNFRNSRMIRLNEMPAVAVTIIPNPAAAQRSIPIGGVGELGVPTFAPALANAYYALTRQRVRTLPFYPTATMGGL